jgi:uncharacterized protein (TIGR02246 family)
MPATRPEDMASVWEQAFNSGDVEQVMALYEPESVLIPEPGQVARGTDAIRQALLGFLALKLPIRLQNKRVLTSGDLAMLSNTWKLAGNGPDGSPIDLGGNTTEILRRQSDGTWRYVFDDPFSMP